MTTDSPFTDSDVLTQLAIRRNSGHHPIQEDLVDVLAKAELRQQTATMIMEQLQLSERWSAVGRPVLVGATAYGLMVAPDIDFEIFCPGQPRIADGFAILAACAATPGTTKARFSNQLAGDDEGLYWQLGYDHDGEEWKIDMWALREDHPGPLSSSMVEPMRAALTPETRMIILTIKQAIADDLERCGSIHVYRAVLEDGVTSPDEFQAWRADHDTQSLTTWRPTGR